ncbi:hypothetical protein [Amycolatopsis sp. H20-H5]|uniref:hypothetical protein n=1 Tax=Amycolatopsis sp. H20-H5 TaxID=3046309 RepID=UPI002DBEF105|nr:hypothetical protein [Amycolatopsis sp. H20-H5]MEC3975926.1 hypothetical protein [Amycolatopsis sp. H20-H5]
MSRISAMIFSAALLAALTACGPAAETSPTVETVTTTVSPSSQTPTTAPSSALPVATTKIAATSTTSKQKTTTPTHSKTACLKDENQCYGPGTNLKCETGSCVDAARGTPESSIRAAQQEWLKEHPGWCPVGTEGAVAPC